MNTHLNSSNNFNELLFENKNKAYGAYAIRKSEKDNISISLLITTAFFGFLVLLTVTLTKAKVEIPDMGGNLAPVLPFVIEMDLTPKVEVPKPNAPETPKSFSGVLEATDDKVNDLDKDNVDPVISDNPNPFGKADTATSTGPGVTLPPVIPVISAKKEIKKVVKVMPKLEGMAQFIASHLKYPRQAIEDGVEGTVYVTFVVETDGSITDIKLLQGIGYGCEQEAMRVVGIMPVWEPGMDDDGPQRVQCNLPIKFRIK